MNFPENLKYSEEHEWVRVEGDFCYIGITDFAQKELGDIVYVDIDSLNADLDLGEIFGTVEAVKTVSDLFMPISGKIVEINKKLVTTPETVNKDAYGEAWMVKVAITKPEELAKLMDSAAYTQKVS